MNILEFLKELKYSCHLQEDIFTKGSCFRLYRILKTIYPNAEPYYSHTDGHWITEIDSKFYDINGEIIKEYVDHKYEKITNKVTLNSAYVPTYKGQSSSYSKYKRSC